MRRLVPFCRSSVGAKIIVAVTGIALFVFLIGHLVGNLLVYSGQQAVNDYAAALKGMPALLWGARIGLLVVFVAHVATTLRLAAQNRAARALSSSPGHLGTPR